MEEQATETQEVKTYTQEDIDKITAKHQEEMNALAGKLRSEFKEKEAKAKAEAEKQAKQAQMTELEKANAELDEYKSKYAEQVSINEIAKQKDETIKLMTEIGVDVNCLDFVFIPQDIEGTKARLNDFKQYVDSVKKATFENGVSSTIPKKGNTESANINALRKSMGLPTK